VRASDIVVHQRFSVDILVVRYSDISFFPRLAARPSPLPVNAGQAAELPDEKAGKL